MKKLKMILNYKVIVIILFLISILRVIFAYNFYSYKTYLEGIYKIIDVKDLGYGKRLILKDNNKIIGYLYDDKTFSIGDKVIIKASKIDNRNNIPNSFNYDYYLKNEGFIGSYKIDEISLFKKNNSIIYKIKSYLLDRCNNIDNSYLSSLLFGNNTFSDNLISSFRVNGISHIFAISGFHITFLLGLLKKVFKSNKLDFILILFLIFYALLLDFKVSIMRSIIFHIFLIINKKTFNLSNTKVLLLTILSIIIFYPLAFYDLGFRYSSIISFSLMFFLNKRKSILKSSLLAFFISLPITINNFNEVNFLSIFYNIFAISYVSYILLPISLIIYIVPYLKFILSFLGDCFSNISIFLSSINTNIIFAKMPIYIIVIYYILLLVLLIKKSKKTSFLILLLITIHYFYYLFIPNFYIMFDVGEGDSSLFYIDGKTVLVDSGESKKYYYGKNIISYLKSLGIRKIDYLVLSHGDSDHINDSFYIIDNFKVDFIYFNSNEIKTLEERLISCAKDKNILIRSLKYQDCFFVSKYKFCNLNKVYSDENNSSIVLYTKISDISFLLTGDIEKEAEDFLVDNYDFKIDILKVAHHGSSTSSSINFLDKFKPKYSLISVGYNNYGHPSSIVLDNLEKYSKVFMTINDGSIKFSFKSYHFFTNTS